MNIGENIEGLKKQLLALGFEDGLERELLSAICFLPETFVIRSRKVFTADTVNFVLHFDEAGPGLYACKFFDASLRKQILFADAGEFLETCEDLDEKMKVIPWETLGDTKIFTALLAREIENIVKGLYVLCVNDTGRDLAARLRFKHWCNTVLEDKVVIPATVRNKFEVSQRFYFFEGEERITAQEAYRFLNNRWMEKQMAAKNKVVAEAASEQEDKTGVSGNGKGKRLLEKNDRGVRRKMQGSNES